MTAAPATMQLATSIAQWVIRLTGVTQVTLGLLFWSGRAYNLLPLHMLIGMVFVIALWVLAGLAAWARLGMRWVLLAVGWGILVPLFGIVHPRLLPGPAHWVVRVVHLLIGIAAMVIAGKLAGYVRKRRDVARSPAASDVLSAA
jgi:hypothetical protein